MPGLLDKRLLIVSGKGGVGKTTVAAALALGAARAGKRTLVCEVNTEERVARLLGHAAVGAEIAPLEENLWAVDVRPQESLKQYVLMIVRYERIYKTVFENKVVRYFLRFIPSVQELVMLGKILYHVKEKDEAGRYRFDTIVVDAPATGHAITFLRVPQVLLDTVPPGQLADDATWMRDLLVDPAITGAVLVSLPEEMPVNETLELAQTLRNDVKVTPLAVVLNHFIPERFADNDLAKLEGKPALISWVRGYLGRQRLSRDAEDKLKSLGLPIFRVPRLFDGAVDRPAMERVLGHLQPLLQGVP